MFSEQPRLVHRHSLTRHLVTNCGALSRPRGQLAVTLHDRLIRVFRFSRANLDYRYREMFKRSLGLESRLSLQLHSTKIHIIDEKYTVLLHDTTIVRELSRGIFITMYLFAGDAKLISREYFHCSTTFRARMARIFTSPNHRIFA